MKKPSPAANRFPEFRSWASEITFGASRDRKLGLSYDLNGQIARAMERAYKQGFEDAQTGNDTINSQTSVNPNDSTPVPSTLISRKIQGPFYSLCSRQVGSPPNIHVDERIRAYFLQETFISTAGRSEPDWRLQPNDDPSYVKGVSDRTIQQLVRLGLLQSLTSPNPKFKDRRILVLSRKGVATYKELYPSRFAW